MKKIILGVTGSISAYKAADIANGLVKSGCNVNVIMTAAAAGFITPLTRRSPKIGYIPMCFRRTSRPL